VVLGLGRARRSGLAEKSHTGNLFSFQLLSSLSASTLAGLASLAPLTAAAALVLSCDSPDGRPRGTPPLPAPPTGEPGEAPGASAMARLLGVDAGELEIPVDPPAPAGDLKAEIDRFTTVDACALERARLDPLVGDALEAIGYDTFLRDACRMIDAAKANDASRCAAIDASSLEARCRANVAEVAGTPDACPWESASRPTRGRDPRCVAVASRDPRLCVAVAEPLERATCEATLGRDDRSCAKVPARAAQSRCSRDAARWRNVLASAGADEARAPPLVVAGKLHVERANRPDADESIDVDLAPDLARGVTILEQRDGARFALGPLTEAGLDFIAPSPHVRASLALELFVTPAPKTQRGAERADFMPRIERAELVVPGRSPLSTPGAQSTLAAKIDKLDPARAGVVTVAVDGNISAAGSTWRVHAEATTFVRDVVRARDVYGALPRPGADGGAR
jgi:hypothetical protein